MKLLVLSECRAASSTGAAVNQTSGVLIGVGKIGDNWNYVFEAVTSAHARRERRTCC
jgi:hypothetical protein